VGRLLRAVGDRRQVLCITHLPLIAAYGARHFEVVKASRGGRTITSVGPLGAAEREREIARLLAGARVTETTVRQARELLRAAAEGSERRPAAGRPETRPASASGAGRAKRTAKGGA
jgi:DNA repair protein RecN (Recombination protein N)